MICPRACFSSKIAALINVYLIVKPEMTQRRAADRVKRGFALELKGTGNLERPRMRLPLALARFLASRTTLAVPGRMLWKEG